MHNIQTLLFGAGMGGDQHNAEAYAEIFKSYPERFGPSYMADGEWEVSSSTLSLAFLIPVSLEYPLLHTTFPSSAQII